MFNNVLGTLQFELPGSPGIFVLYLLTAGAMRSPAMIHLGVATVLHLPPPYLGFALDAGSYESHRPRA